MKLSRAGLVAGRPNPPLHNPIVQCKAEHLNKLENQHHPAMATLTDFRCMTQTDTTRHPSPAICHGQNQHRQGCSQSECFMLKAGVAAQPAITLDAQSHSSTAASQGTAD